MKPNKQKTDYAKEFEAQLGNPIEQVDKLIKQAKALITDRGGSGVNQGSTMRACKATPKVRPLTIEDPKWTGVSENKQKTEWVEDFDEKWVKAPDFHDPNTHQNYPAEVLEMLADSGKIIKLSEIKSFIAQLLKTQREEIIKDLKSKTDNLNYKKMVKDIYKLVGTDFAMDMDRKCLPHSNPYTQEEANKMAGIIGQIYFISHCYYCKACQGKYLIEKK